MPPDEYALELVGVRKRFVAGVPGCRIAVRALDGVDWRVRAGELALVEGARGSGKSTLLLCAAGLLRPDSGLVRSFGAPVAATRVGFVAPTDGRRAGMRVREALAAAPPAPLMLLDLGANRAEEVDGTVLRMLRSLRADGLTVIAAARDACSLHRVADRVLELRCGRVHLAREGALRGKAPTVLAPVRRRTTVTRR